MPYKVVKTDGKAKVINTETGHVKAKATTPARAQAQVNLLRGIEHGWKPTGKPATHGAAHGGVVTTRQAIGLDSTNWERVQHVRGRQPPVAKPIPVRTTRQVIGMAGGGEAGLAARRAARRRYEEARATKPLGEGSRFKALEASARASGARSPAAVAAVAGRRAHGKEAMAKMAAAGRHRAAQARHGGKR